MIGLVNVAFWFQRRYWGKRGVEVEPAGAGGGDGDDGNKTWDVRRPSAAGSRQNLIEGVSMSEHMKICARSRGRLRYAGIAAARGLVVAAAQSPATETETEAAPATAGGQARHGAPGRHSESLKPATARRSWPRCRGGQSRPGFGNPQAIAALKRRSGGGLGAGELRLLPLARACGLRGPSSAWT